MEIFFIVATIIGIPSGLFGAYQAYRLLRGSQKERITASELDEALTTQKRELLEEIEDVFNHSFAVAKQSLAELVERSEEARLRVLKRATQAQRSHRFAEAAELLKSCLQPDPPPSQRAAIHILIGNALLPVSGLGPAQLHYEEALIAATEAHDERTKAVAFDNLGMIYWEKGEYDLAQDHVRRASAIYDEERNLIGQARTLNNLGLIAYRRWDLDDAKSYYKEGLAVAQEAHIARLNAFLMKNLGLVFAACKDLDMAEEHYQKALQLTEKIDYPELRADTLGDLGLVLQERKEYDGAEQNFRAALGIHQRVGNRIGEANMLCFLGLLADERDYLEQARYLLAEARELYQHTGAGWFNASAADRALERLNRKRTGPAR